MTELVTKTGDTSPLPRYQLLDGGGTPVNLTGATVVQHFAGAPSGGSPCDIDGDPTDGIVRLASRDDLPTPISGQTIGLAFETEVTYSNNDVQTFPTAGYDQWTIWWELDTS